MRPSKINILSTRPLNASLINEAGIKNIAISVQSFIETEPVRTRELQQAIEKVVRQKTTVVFTSVNAVEAVVQQMRQQPAWSIYCIGNTTNKLARKYFGDETIAGTASHAAELARLIVEKNHITQLTFFCGDQRRDELPDILRNNKIRVNEIIVYETTIKPHKINKEYAGILFFSPSAVKSFFKLNRLSTGTLLFAIGNTTATEIKKYSPNKIIISDETGKESLVKKMIRYYYEQ